MPYERVVLGPRYEVRLEDLWAEHAVMIECVPCRHKPPSGPTRAHNRKRNVGTIKSFEH